MAFRKIDMQLIETDIADIQDPLVALNYGYSGANTRDLGLLMDRGSSTNVAFIWDESEDHFAVVNSTESGSTEGNITISGYADIKANSFIGNVTGDITGNLTGNITGNLTGNVTGNVTGDLTGASTGAHNGTVGATTPSTGVFTTVSASSGFTGNLTGNVTGSTTGINYGNVTATVGTSTFNNVTVNGNLTLNGTTTTVNSTTIDVTNSFTFEGSTADANETVLGVIDPTADRTINLPDASGTAALLESTQTFTGAITFDASGNSVIVSDTLRIAQSGSGLRMTNVGAFDNDGSDNFRIYGTNNLYLRANGENGGGLSIDSTNQDVTIDNDLRVSAGQFYYGGTAVTATATELNYVDGVTSAIQTQLDAKQASLTHNENSSPYVVTSTDATNNTSSTLAITAATLGFDLSGAISYTIFINRLHLRSSEVSVNTSNGTLTFSADILETSDEIDAVWID